MKNIKINLLLALLFAALSCGKNFGDLNTDPNNPQLIPAEYLLTSAEKTLADNLSFAISTSSFSPPAEALVSQTWAMNNYTEPSRYSFSGDWFNVWWSAFYSGVLTDLQDLQKVVAENPGLDAAQDRNKVAIAKILQAYGFQVMTDCFGPVPYAEALRGAGNRAPKFDDPRDIYLGLLASLHTAIGELDVNAPSFGSADVIFGGDVARWKKFAHALVLRLAVRMSDVEPALAKTEAEFAAAGGLPSDNADNACFQYLGGPPNNSPYHKFRVDRGDADLGLSNILIDKTLKPLNDPRLPKFADERVGFGGGYFGRPFGQNSDNAASDAVEHYSQPSGAAVVREGRNDFQATDVVRPDATACLLGYAEVCFNLAEGRERGWAVGGTAWEWYTSGVVASLNEWGVADAAAQADYLAQADVDYLTAPGDWKQKIGVQKWLAFFMQGVQGWAEWRRLDFQKLEPPVDGVINDVGGKAAPVRLPYPTTEQTLNAVHYREAVQRIGGFDDLKTRVWWDVQ